MDGHGKASAFDGAPSSHGGPLSFRDMEREDVPAVAALELAAFRDESPWSEDMFLDELGNRLSKVILAELTDGSGVPRLAGFAVLWNVCGELQINDVAVHPELRRRGIGSRLIGEALRWAEGQGATSATLEVRKKNLPAIGLYRRLGFTQDGVRRGYYEDGEDALLMSRELGPGGGERSGA